MPVDITRRNALKVTATFGTMALAGCSNILGGSNPDVVVFNDTDSEKTAEITLVSDGGEEVVSATETISSDGAFERDDVLPEDDTLTFSVAVDSGPSGEEEFDVSDASSLQARIDGDDIEFDKL